jgi:hypothetical protein
MSLDSNPDGIVRPRDGDSRPCRARGLDSFVMLSGVVRAAEHGESGR